ncbi:MAG: hypothetical protein Q8896_14085, partial [Bacteroidota bacterium]|nr:hypothetical protein [Bacteroidota bacterium]
MRLYQSLPICFSVVLSCILFSACDKNPAEKQPLHSEKPSPSPEYAIINTIDAMDKGDSAQLVSTFLSTSRAKVIDSFMEVRKMMSGASGTTTVPWKVQIQRTDIDKSNPNTAIVIFSLEKDD